MNGKAPPRGPYYRTGEPGAPGCRVAGSSISLKSADASLLPAVPLDAGTNASELNFLRNLAHVLGIRWG